MSAQLKDLPQWNLGDLYPGSDSPELEADFKAAEKEALSFAETYKGTLGGLDGAGLGEAISRYESLSEILYRIMSYSGLVFAGDQSDSEIARFFQTAQERVTDITTHLLFFTLELNRLDDEVLDEKLKHEAAAHYAPWLRDLRVLRPHQLSDDLEALLHEKHVAGSAAWIRLFDESMAALRFPFTSAPGTDSSGSDSAGDTKDLTEAEILNLMSDPDGPTRKQAAESLGEVLDRNIRLFALITNTLAKDKEVEDKWRQYEKPVSQRNRANHVEDEVVDALADSVARAYPSISHRYYTMKARWFGVDKLDYWDRNAPLPEEDDRLIPWDEARTTVLDAYGAFSGEMADLGGRFFDKPWIDAPPRAGKASGAFSHPTVPSAHPYILLNYQGRIRDVMTLAHELGHGVHQILAAPQGTLMSETPLTLAETASVFGEMLVFRAVLEKQPDPARRKGMLAAKVEDMLNTVVRQIAMYRFEEIVHNERRGGELTAERLGEIWVSVQTEALGPAFRLGGNFRHFWAYIPHFIHSPFYVYAYAFGDCLVNSLYAAYQDSDAGFAEKYLQMLRAGGTLRHQELLAPFGLNAADPAFWDKGLGVLSGFIDELEGMD